MTDLPAFIRAQLDAATRVTNRLNCATSWTAVAGVCGPEVQVTPASRWNGVESWTWARSEIPQSVWDCDDYSDYEGCAALRNSWMAEAEFIAANDPKAVLQGIEAVRAILDLHQGRCCPILGEAVGDTVLEWYDSATDPCPTLRAQAMPYRHLPGFKPDWEL